MIRTDEHRHLLFDADGVGPNPHRQTNHTGLVHDVVIQTWSNVDAHRPDFLVFGITVGVHCRLGITPTFAASVITSARCTAASWPVHARHVEVDVVRNLHVRVVFLDPVVGPEVAAALSTFLTRPQAEHHGVSRVEIGHGFGYRQDHGRSRRVVVSTDSGSVGTAENVRVEHTTVHRWCNVEVGTKHHPFVRVDLTESIATDVVRLGVLGTGHEGIVGKPLRDHFKSETLEVSDEVLCSIFVGSVSLACPSVEVPHGTVRCIGGVGRFIRHVADVIEHVETVDQPRRVPPSFSLAVGGRHGPFDRYSDSENSSAAAVGGKNRVQRSVGGGHALDTGVVRLLVPISLNPRSPRFLDGPDGPVLSTVLTQHHHGGVGSWWRQQRQHDRLTGFHVNDR